MCLLKKLDDNGVEKIIQKLIPPFKMVKWCMWSPNMRYLIWLVSHWNPHNNV
jgi:hypothetical protein